MESFVSDVLLPTLEFFFDKLAEWLRGRFEIAYAAG